MVFQYDNLIIVLYYHNHEASVEVFTAIVQALRLGPLVQAALCWFHVDIGYRGATAFLQPRATLPLT